MLKIGDEPANLYHPLTLIQFVNGKSVATINVSINKNLPLIVVDNKPYQIEGLDYKVATAKEIMQAIDPSVPEIKSSTIIKGEAAERIKGVRGKNGIILITTKK